MPTSLPKFCATFLIVALTNAALADDCYVIGDTSKNNSSKPVGSKQNPYGSLVAIEADPVCDTIIVLYSNLVLDGGISLRDGQELIGIEGKRGQIPTISNTTARNNGHGVQLSVDNSIANLHITDTQNSGVNGGDVGKLSIENSLITRFALSEEVSPDPAPVDFVIDPSAGIEIHSNTDAKIRVSDTEIGEADSTSVEIYVFGGHADIAIEDVSVRDQGHLVTANFSNGIKVIGFGQSSIDLKVVNTSISNIGEGLSNSDALLVLAAESSAIKALIDGYAYDNPDGDGFGGSTGMEVGNFLGVGASFEGTIMNSLIRGPSGVGIQAIDQGTGNNNYLNVHIHDNEIYDAGAGIEVDLGFGASYGTDIVTIENNLIVNSQFSGIGFFNAFEPQTLVDFLIQRNTIINSGFEGIFFAQIFGANVASLNLDAGLGALGSEGKNRIIDSQQSDIFAEAFNAPAFSVSAANNWWGSEAGPTAVFEGGGVIVDVTPFLTEDPGDD